MNNKTNVFVKLIKSTYSVGGFPKYMKEGKGRAIFYILILCLILGGAKAISNVVNIDLSVNKTIEDLNEDKYQFKINDGVMDIETSPLEIDENNTLVYIDENTTLAEADNLRSMTINSDIYILILRDGVIVNSTDQSGLPEMKTSYKEIGFQGEINNEVVINSINSFKILIYFVVIIVSIAQLFITYLITTLFISVFSMISNRLLKLNLKLGELFSLVAYIGTLPNILITILGILMPTALFSTAGIVGTVVYTGLILNNMKKSMDENIKIQ
ncbi:DUF1189 family protein [Clostridium vincentii]|uniref:DUF1189 domain-containing protein n=1 Tax=Clostridium vincentii TaxID=52704 RepID=A0A2T0BCK5_9CLOT|nr:DUF1189 family protein [Clostridium vincentii]PRR81575.1 hypothetical protein CLVI_24130 [Clostridium vincentii]